MTTSKGLVTLAALSFEDRCTSATAKMIDANTKPALVAMLDYGSTATLGPEAATRRQANWDVIYEQCAKSSVRASRRSINAYSMVDLEGIICEIADLGTKLLFDITCMTRPHVLGLAVALAKLRQVERWSIAYTKPLSYGDLNSATSSGGWRDTLWLPLGDDPILKNEGLALGLLAVGHEADRSGLALREIEPAAGLAIYACRRDRPDLHRAALDANRLLFEYLRQLRMPGPRGRSVREHFKNGGWEIIAVHMETAVEEMSRAVARVIKAALALDSPIVFIPFGPKLVVFIAAWLLASVCADRSWAIYPVARTHPLHYSDGTLGTMFVEGAVLESSRRTFVDSLSLIGQ